MYQILAQATEAVSNSWDTTLTTGGTAAAILAAIWVFMKVLRTVVGILFMICVVFLVLKVCFNIDISEWLLPLFQ